MTTMGTVLGCQRGMQGGSLRTSRETLIIHPGALGDVLQAVPALRALAREAPVTFAGQPRLGRLLRELGAVQFARSFDALGLEALFADARPSPALASTIAGFERVISWFGSRDETYGRGLRTLARETVIAPPVPDDRDDALPVWRHLLKTIGHKSAPETAPLAPPAAWADKAQQALVAIGRDPARPLFVVHPGAGAAWKRWPVDRFALVIEGVAPNADAQVVIHQGPADREAADQLMQILPMPLIRLIEPELPVLAAVLANATAYLGGDSGVSHLAAAVGAPAVIVFPSGTRERWAPWSPTAATFAMSDDAAGTERVMAAVGERLTR